eukprot:12438308-Prorocentrum_lima.AAC.1
MAVSMSSRMVHAGDSKVLCSRCLCPPAFGIQRTFRDSASRVEAECLGAPTSPYNGRNNFHTSPFA